MKKTIIALSLASLLASPALYADCGKDSKVLFSCLTAKNKRIEVCDNTKTVSYSFGKSGEKPEIALSVPRSQAKFSPWNGVSDMMEYSLAIPNGDTVYSVFVSSLRAANAKTSGGVMVSVKGAAVATIDCAGKVTDKIQDFDPEYK